ncbi:hypothetical protein G9A89_020656 [Geosiphon pyriformis]|nr:hypothetical protein G9A89_020656 [Geosiphon pyriformis]
MKFRTSILISKWCIELKRRTQGSGKAVTKYAKAIRKLIKQNKISIPLQRIKNRSVLCFLAFSGPKRQFHNKYGFFASVPVMVPASQMAATSFTAQTSDPNEQLIDRLTANFQSPYQRQQNHGLPVCYCCGLTGHFSRDCNSPPLSPLVFRNNNNQNNRTTNNNVPNQRSNHANINFFGENSLSKSANQPEENFFYAFNLTDNDHDINKLAINTSESTRKKKKAKINFVINPKKIFTSNTNNNKPPKAKVFKNSPKLESSKIVQKSGPYFVVKDLMETPTHITFGQLITHLHNVTFLICKAQAAGYFIDLILDSGSFVNVISKHFFEAIGRKIDESSIRPMNNIYGDKKKNLDIAKAISVHINISEIKEYTIIVGNKWLKKAKTLLDYELCELIIRCSEKPIVVKCCHWTTFLISKQNQEEKQSDESDDDESNEEKDQEEQKKTVEFADTIFISNDKSLDNVKADKKGIMVNGKLICWPYYNILKRIFNRKPGKKAKYSYWCWCNKPLYSPSNECKFCLIYYKNWEPISLIPREELKKVQKSFKSKSSEIQLIVIEQKEPSPEKRKVDIKNLLARNSPVILKEGDTPGCIYVIQHTITTRETCPIHLKPY